MTTPESAAQSMTLTASAERSVDYMMEAISCFASEWSLVGGRFDNGDMLERAQGTKQRIRRILEADAAALAAHDAASAPQPAASIDRDASQLIGLLLVNPENGLPLTFAGPLESWGMGLNQAKVMDQDGNVWTLVAGLREGYKSEAQPVAKLTLALPDYETRRIVIASDEVIDGERLVCVAIKPAPVSGAYPEKPV